MNSNGTRQAPAASRRFFRGLLLVLGVSLITGVWLFREPLRRWIFAESVLANDAPAVEAIEQTIRQAADPRAAILAAWRTGKIVQRQVAIQQLSRVVPPSRALSRQLREMLLAAALDPDMDVRELALGDLDYRHDPALPALIAAQLGDLDSQTRLLGLMHLKQAAAGVGVPLVIPLLDDADPQVVAWALNLLERWSGEKFGVKLAGATPIEDPKTGLQKFRQESYAKTHAAAERAKAWWAKHQADYPPVHLKIPAEALAAVKPLYAEDFSLRTLDGRRVRLSDFRGQVVLINFWTTWCTACVGEMPELIALQKRHTDRLAILGVSLDFVPDEDRPGALPPAQAIRAKVARTVKSRGINYPVLLDEHNLVGGRFNGGELPTTVILDAEGRIRRRFVGARRLAVFEKMIAEASRPLSASGMRSNIAANR